MIGYVISRQEKNFLKKIFNRIESEEYENGRKYSIPKLNEKLLNKLKMDNIKNVVIAKKNKLNIEFMNEVYSSNMNILDGKILFKHLIPEIIEYLSEILGTNKEDIEITILVNDYSQINLYYINELINNIKRIYIITNNIKRFKAFANKLYEEEAITVPVMNNRNKSLSNKKVILNIDFTEEQLNKYKINRKAILINIENDIKNINKTFAGINVNNYELNVEKDENEFEKNEIYESYIIGKKIKDIRRKLGEDKIKIRNFIGNRGIINVNEYINKKNKNQYLTNRKY